MFLFPTPICTRRERRELSEYWGPEGRGSGSQARRTGTGALKWVSSFCYCT